MAMIKIRPASAEDSPLILCFITFAAIVVWVFFFRSKPSYDHVRNLPLDDTGAAKGGDTS